MANSKTHLFVKGNKMWHKRSKFGRDKTFKSPKLLMEAAVEYFHWCEDNPLLAEELKVVSNGNGLGSNVEAHELKKVRAFTIMGLCLFCGVNTEYWRTFKHQLVVNKNNTQRVVNAFNSVIVFIENTIYEQKFSAAAAGLLNANIISRDLGLIDKVQSENINYNSVPMSKDEMKNIADELEKDI